MRHKQSLSRTDAVHSHRTQVYTEVMSDTQTVTIHLSSEERGLLVRHRSERASDRPQAEAKRLRIPSGFLLNTVSSLLNYAEDRNHSRDRA
jgi:hypothetical protein